MASVLDAITSLLLKHTPEELSRGEFTLAPAVPWLVVALVMVGGAVATVLAVRQLRGTTPGSQLLLGGLRAAIFLVLGLCLLRPSLVLSRAIPQRNVVGVLLDDSRSMQVGDHPAGSRLLAVQAAWADSSAVVRALGDRFVLRFFRVGGAVARVPGAAALTGQSSRSDLATALAGARDALADAPLAGLVLVSDGADNAATDLEEELLALEARGIPVHTVGVGTTRFERDVGVDAVRLPESVLEGGEAVGEVLLRLRGVAGERLRLEVEAAGRLVQLDTVTLASGEELTTLPLRIPPLEAGVHRVSVRVDLLGDEPITTNNNSDAVLRVRAGPERILHIEGEPRPDLPFLRRAVAGDSALQVVTLVRSAPGKFLRLGVSDSLELLAGFPTTREELFRYRAIVLGSMEASFFTAGQMRMLEEFVSVRGGGLLALGGRRSLAEGGWDGTALGSALPVEWGGIAPWGGDASAQMVAVQPSGEGSEHPVLALGADQRTTAAQWNRLPMVSIVNAPGRPKPGATVLLEGRTGPGTTPIPVMITQRYGRGKATVLALQDLWRWQLNTEVPEDDATLTALWPRLLRWTLDGVADQVELAVEPRLVAPGDEGGALLRLHDADFLPDGSGRPVVTVLPPDALESTLPLAPVLGEPGQYALRIPTTVEGNYRLTVRRSAADTGSVAVAELLAVAMPGETGPVERDAALLDEIARRTDGSSFDIDALDGLPDAVTLTRAGITVKERNDLWDAPILLLTLLGLLVTDWTLRRRWGLG